MEEFLGQVPWDDQCMEGPVIMLVSAHLFVLVFNPCSHHVRTTLMLFALFHSRSRLPWTNEIMLGDHVPVKQVHRDSPPTWFVQSYCVAHLHVVGYKPLLWYIYYIT